MVSWVEWAFEADGIKDPLEVLVLLRLAAWAGRDSVASPSVAAIAASCRCSPRKASYCLAKLHERGFIERIERRGDDGRSLANGYRVLVDDGMEANHEH